MATPSYSIVCTQRKKLTHNVYELHFSKPDGFTFNAGQFVLFQMPSVDHPNDIQARAYSIASSPQEEELIFCIKIVPEGRAGKWIEQKLEKGTDMQMQGPFGMFTIDPSNEKDIAMICTGVGTAPFRSQILSLVDSGTKIDLVYCVHTEDDMFWNDFFGELAQKHSNFHYHAVIAEPHGEWAGPKGYVQDVIRDVLPDITQKQVYLCGNPNMTKEMKRMCVEDLGISKEDVKMEGYI